ncbi:hypothetical protein GCM10010193_40040 [Kitasatospora atroaurantiaca]
MGGLTTLGLGDRLDVLGPLPTRFEYRPAHRPRIEVDESELALALFEWADFFGRIQALTDETSYD